MKWYVPSWTGDMRLLGAGEEKSVLVLTEPTLREGEIVAKFLEIARKKKWTTKSFAEDTPVSKLAENPIELDAHVSVTGAELVRIVTGQKRASVTGVLHTNGKIEVTETIDPALEEKVAEAAKEPPDKKKEPAAATTKRPTPSCPDCEPGAIGPASEVLLTFMDDQQHKDWAKHRVLEVEGGVTGHRYLVGHRHSKSAQDWKRIVYDADNGGVMHFYDWSVPPEEEVLAALLILGSRFEAWLRNEATCLGFGRWTDVLKNPFGGLADGTESAGLFSTVGALIAGATGRWGVLERELAPSPVFLADAPFVTYPNPPAVSVCDVPEWA